MTLFVANEPLNTKTTDLTANILDLNAGPHTLTWKGFKQVLTIENNEAVSITIKVLGQGVTAVVTPGLDTVTLTDVTNNEIVVPASATVTINLDVISGYMGVVGNVVDITITGSTAPALAFSWLNEYS